MRKYLIGIGLILSVIYYPNALLTTYFFPPQIAIGFFVAAIVLTPFKEIKEHGLGSKWVWVPLLLLSFSISASGIAQYLRGEVTLIRGLAPLCSSLIWFGLYMLARIEGNEIGKPFAIAVIIETISIVAFAFVNHGIRGGGLISPTNYDISTAFLVIGVFLSPKKWQWWLSGIAVVGLFFSGAEEGIVAIGAVALVILLVKDYSLKTLFPACTLIVALLVATPMGITHNLYLSNKSIDYGQNISTVEKGNALIVAIGGSDFSKNMDIATGYRWSTHWRIRPIQPFGYGYNLTQFYWGIPHNIFLIIIEQVGILGLIGWVIATAYCIKTSRRWYLWGSFLALGMFDHYFFTQWAAVTWVLWGISEAHPQIRTNIFKPVTDWDI